MKKHFIRVNADDAVSPVVGIMLMLVVTIIIAAVVSAFAGGLATGQKTAPTMTMEMRLTNTGSCGSSELYWKVLGVSEPINTKDVKIVTSWKAKDGTTGGTTVLPWTPGSEPNTHYHRGYPSFSILVSGQNPRGYGPGINWTWSGNYFNQYTQMQFGNYTFIPGVIFQYWPGVWDTRTGVACGYGAVTQYTYTEGICYDPAAGDVDDFQAILGMNWEHLRAGDNVKFKFIHIPTGKTIMEKDVTVSGETFVETG